MIWRPGFNEPHYCSEGGGKALEMLSELDLQWCAQLTVPYLSRYYECLRQRSLCSDSNKSNSLHLYNVYYVLGTLTNLVFKITL